MNQEETRIERVMAMMMTVNGLSLPLTYDKKDIIQGIQKGDNWCTCLQKDESWIKNIKQHDTFLTLGVKKGEEKIPVIFEIARNLNIKIKSISVRKPTLDDVFLHFTGRTMRDQEERNTVRESLPPRFRSGSRGISSYLYHVATSNETVYKI